MWVRLDVLTISTLDKVHPPSSPCPGILSHPWVSDQSRVLRLRRGGDPELCLVGTAFTHVLGVESQVERVLVAQVHVFLLAAGGTWGGAPGGESPNRGGEWLLLPPPPQYSSAVGGSCC